MQQSVVAVFSATATGAGMRLVATDRVPNERSWLTLNRLLACYSTVRRLRYAYAGSLAGRNSVSDLRARVQAT